tara:strand:+ start:515 stop:670 length:156 start_codon:yes stop_codon:yes gene_type:complete
MTKCNICNENPASDVEFYTTDEGLKMNIIPCANCQQHEESNYEEWWGLPTV